MGLAIILRQTTGINRFRDLLIGSINTGLANHALICSGFFQDSVAIPPSYQASCELNFCNVLANNNVSVTSIGTYSYGKWQNSYFDFIANMTLAGVNIQAYIKAGRRWHAKMFILSDNNGPVFGIIGSSNLTRPAFSTGGTFNNECDVILWDNNFPQFGQLVDDVFEANEDEGLGMIRGEFLPDRNLGATEKMRLEALRQEAMNVGLERIL